MKKAKKQDEGKGEDDEEGDSIESEDRVAKFHRYGRYICAKILEGWGKKVNETKTF